MLKERGGRGGGSEQGERKEVRRGREREWGDTDENISPIENPIFAILTKIHLYKYYVWIAMIQRVFEQALFSRLKVQMHKDLKIGQRPWSWQQYVSWHYTWSLSKIYPPWNRAQKCSRVNTQCREWNYITIMGLETCNGFYKSERLAFLPILW